MHRDRFCHRCHWINWTHFIILRIELGLCQCKRTAPSWSELIFNTNALENFQAKSETNDSKTEENSTLQIEGINYVLPSELPGDIGDYTVVVLPEGTTVSNEKLEIALSGHVDEHKLVLQQETMQAMLGMAGTTNDNPRTEDPDKKKGRELDPKSFSTKRT